MPRTLAQNAQYIAETIKPAIKQAIEDKGVTVPSTDSFLDYADRIGEISGGGSGYQLKDLPTGSISTVSDAEALPLNALTVSVEAWQDLHGYDHPWVGGAGKNKLPIKFNASGTNSGITYSVAKDNADSIIGITLSGTASADVDLLLINSYGSTNTFATMDNYIVNNENALSGIQLHVGYGYQVYSSAGGSADRNINATNGISWVILRITSGTVINGTLTVKPMIRLATVADAIFEPYENICPITGWSTATITDKDDLTTPTQTKTWTHAFTDSQGNPLTCYGGEWNVVDGSLSVTDGYIASYNGETLPSTWISDRDVYASGTTPTTGAEVVYKLATPTTIPQQPEVIRMLEGVNNLYADCGEVIEGEYFVDEGALDTRKVDYSIGSNTAVKVTDGRVLSGFASMSGYHSRPLDASGNWLDVDWSKDFEIGVAFKFTSLSANQAIFASADANRELVPTILWVASDATGQNQLRVLVSTDGSSWEVACITSFVPTINTFYFIKMKYESATKKCITQVTSDFIDWTVIENDTLATHPYYNGAGTAIGGRGGSSAWATNNLLIDTFNTYIKGDGVNWGAFTGAFPS